MSHQIIITNPPPGGGNLAAIGSESTVDIGEVRWTPSHELAPAEERHRIEKAEKLLGNLRELLTAPPEKV